MTIHAFNSLDHAGFMNAIAWIFEHSPWVAERASAVRPFESIDALHLALVDQVEHASEAEQLALLRAHPDLGTRARMSDASTAEQSGAGLDRLTPQVDFPEELKKGNIAVAIFIAAIFLSIAIIVAGALN